MARGAPCRTQACALAARASLASFLASIRQARADSRGRTTQPTWRSWEVARHALRSHARTAMPTVPTAQTLAGPLACPTRRLHGRVDEPLSHAHPCSAAARPGGRRASMRARSSSLCARSRRVHHTILSRLRSSSLMSSNLSKPSSATSAFSTSASSSVCAARRPSAAPRSAAPALSTPALLHGHAHEAGGAAWAQARRRMLAASRGVGGARQALGAQRAARCSPCHAISPVTGDPWVRSWLELMPALCRACRPWPEGPLGALQGAPAAAAAPPPRAPAPPRRPGRCTRPRCGVAASTRPPPAPGTHRLQCVLPLPPK